MSVLVIAEDVNSGRMEETEVMEETIQMPTVFMSLSSVMGISNPKTMMLKGQIEGVEVILMIDQGATDNVMSHKTVRKLNLPYSASVKFGVTL